MAGQLKVNGVTLATEESGTVTLEAPQIKDSSNNVILDQSGTNPVLKPVEVVNNSSMMFRNKVINGGMKISQRGTSFNFAHDGTVSAYTLDRYKFQVIGSDEYDCTVSQYSMSAAELNATGHSKAFKLLTGTAESTIANDEMVNLQYKIEGQDVQDLQYGTASAKSMTLSFWVKSSITGTYAVSFYKDDATQRIINRTYTINSANTWENKTISIVGDTDSTGSIVNDNGEGFRIIWGFASGSTYDGSTSTSWTDYTDAYFLGGHAQDGVVTTAGADWYLTGVQLEVGTVATPFEHRPYGVELALCQRYYFKTFNQSVVPAQAVDYSGSLWGSSSVTNISFSSTMKLPVSMRTTPNPVTVYSTTSSNSNWSLQSGVEPTSQILGAGENAISVRATGSVSAGGAHSIHITAEAEL